MSCRLAIAATSHLVPNPVLSADHVAHLCDKATPATGYLFHTRYDVASQLLSDSIATYRYDAQGNRTMAGYQTGTNNELSTDGTWTYTFDNEGNQTQKTQGSGSSTVTWNYGFDNFNRLTSAVELTGSTLATTVQATYTYDVFNNRVDEDKWEQPTGTVTVRHAYDGQNVWADVDTSNNVLARYLYGDAVDQIWARAHPTGQPNPGVAWYLTDRLGSVRDLTNGTGTLQDHLDYNGYVGIVTETTVSFGDRYKGTAREYDYDTNLQYNRGRYYDAATGRWLSQDPISFKAGDDNLYRYVKNRPTISTVGLP